MAELWLEFRNESGETERIRVQRDEFVIGRHSSCDLSISNPSVSRQHAVIARYGESFEVSDSGSTFGSVLNGTKLNETIVIKNGDVLTLGNEIDIRIELISDASAEPELNAPESAPKPAPAAQVAPKQTAGSSIPTSIFYIAPIFALLILVCTGGVLFFAFDGIKSAEKAETDDFSTPRRDKDRSPTKEPEKEKIDGKTSPEITSTNEPDATQAPPNVELTPAPKNSSESEKIERISPSFLRKVVRNDPNAFLSSKQIEILTPKVNQFKSSTALSSNIKDAKSNASQISALASSTNLTPLFLATASLAKLGNQRGNVVDTAKSMVEVLEKLNGSIGVETADEALLVIAAYDQGVAGKFTQLRNTVEGLSSKSQGVTARQVRTIWFLHDQKKLSDGEFEFALRFLAIGTITQKPSDFSVNAEALNF
jgi:pSer/pThr/pTyr-binding forkhead associated (FHA) protein